MDEQIKQIAERLRGLRDAMELTTEELASDCGIDNWPAIAASTVRSTNKPNRASTTSP